MQRTVRSGFAALLTAILMAAGCSQLPEDSDTATAESADTELPTLKSLRRGWNRIEPAGDTACSDGSDYAFFVRRGDPRLLLFYLQGGGACWNGATCDPLLDPTYSIRAPASFPERYDGIFNFRRDDNPFRDYTVVFVPYCSADVHIGDATVVYERSDETLAKIREKQSLTDDASIDRSFTIEHRGFANTQAALDWTYTNVEAPEDIFVTGSSAGSIPSPYYAMRIARQYGDAEVIQLGDAAGGYRRSEQTGNPNVVWNTVPVLSEDPAFAALTNENFTYEQLYLGAAADQPDIIYAAYDAAEDSVQKRFLALSGVEMPSLKAAIEANQRDIRAGVPDFRSYIAGGDSHTILARPEFYRFTADGYPVRKWVDDLRQGKTIGSVVCDPCDQAALTPED